jgi:protoporphyrinogen oxidase
LVVPFPLQAHLEYLPSRIRTQAERELSRETTAGHEEVQTQAQWLELQFGPTLNDLFFAPFHDSYTAGLYKEVAPQDAYKTPRAASRQHLYNEEFVYPSDGLDRVIQGMTTSMLGELRLNHRVTSVDPESKRLVIDGTNDVAFDRVALTVPLDQALELCHLSTGTPDPATGVLVLNLGAQRGSRCPDEHWVYVARAKSGFHRVGFYSNVDAEFSPHNTVGIYIEKAFLTRPNEQEQTRWAKQTIAELEEWEWIGAVEAMDVTWSYPAYTYVRPGSNWRADSLAALESIGVTMVGRYARWEFQGIAKSIAEGRRTGDHWRRLQPEVERANSRRPSA